MGNLLRTLSTLVPAGWNLGTVASSWTRPLLFLTAEATSLVGVRRYGEGKGRLLVNVFLTGS
jgi:hypothetical protein